MAHVWPVGSPQVLSALPAGLLRWQQPHHGVPLPHRCALFGRTPQRQRLGVVVLQPPQLPHNHVSAPRQRLHCKPTCGGRWSIAVDHRRRGAVLCVEPLLTTRDTTRVAGLAPCSSARAPRACAAPSLAATRWVGCPSATTCWVRGAARQLRWSGIPTATPGVSRWR